MTIDQVLRQIVGRLSRGGIPDAPRDGRRLVAFAAGLSAERLTLHLGDPFPTPAGEKLEGAVMARLARQPVAQITGTRLFWGRTYRVTRDTLDPRPETEILVAAALERPFRRMLDLGTGTGCILLSCLGDMPGAVGLGTDMSDAALLVAAENARNLRLIDRVHFQRADWFDGVKGTYDLITSNPPYIAEPEMAALSPEVREWEPRLALTPGGDGLDAYRAIAAGAVAHLAPRGRLMVEIGPTQATAVSTLFVSAGLTGIDVLLDLDGRDRVVVASRAGSEVFAETGVSLPHCQGNALQFAQ